MKTRPSRNFVFGTGFLFLIAAFNLIAAGIAFGNAPDRGVRVIVSPAVKATMADRIEALGTLKANESVTLSANVTETISRINFEEGQKVEAQAVLVEMTSREERALLDEAESRLEEARRQFERSQALEKARSVSASVVDERRRDFEAASAQLNVVKSRLGDRIIEAPFAGQLGLRNVSVGTLVQPGDPIVTLDDLRTMKLDFSIPSTFLDAVRPGDEIVARARGLGDEEFKGQVKHIDTRIDPVTRSLVVRAVLPNSEGRLRPGLLMSVQLLSRKRESIVIPEEALLSEGKRKFLFLVTKSGESPVLERREIETGAREPGIVEIVRGVNEGDLVVVHGTMQARNGAPASIIGEKRPGESLEEVLARAGDKK